MQNQTIANQTISNQTKYYYNGHNLVIFESRRLKFCMVVHLENTQILYHEKLNEMIPNQTKPNHTKTKPNIPLMAIIQSILKLEASNFTW